MAVLTEDEMTRAPAIERQNLHAEVLGVLREAIIEGRLKAGERLNERLLCEHFGISRTPLREAFKVLAAEGILTLLPNRGAILTPLSLTDFEATIAVMAHLEKMVGELAAQRISDEGILAIRALHYDMYACFMRGELKAYFKLNQEIHFGLAEATGNEVLATTYRTLNTKVRRYRYQANLKEKRWKAAIEEHEEFLRALVVRDGKLLGELLCQHLLNKAAAIRESMG